MRMPPPAAPPANPARFTALKRMSGKQALELGLRLAAHPFVRKQTKVAWMGPSRSSLEKGEPWESVARFLFGLTSPGKGDRRG